MTETNPRQGTLGNSDPIARISFDNPKHSTYEGNQYIEYTATLDGIELGKVVRIETGSKKRLYTVRGLYFSNYGAKQYLFNRYRDSQLKA